LVKGDLRFMKRHKNLKLSGTDLTLMVFVYTFLIICLLVILYPIIYIVSCSFSSVNAVMRGKVWLFPVEPTLIGYATVFRHPLIMTGFANSLFYTVVGTIINVIVTIMAGYPLSRRDFVGKNIIMAIFVFTMFFSGGLIPSYLLVRNLGMLNTRWSMLIPGAMSVFYVIITRTFFKATIPDELTDAAEIDGCNDLFFVIKIVIPLSGAIIAVIALFYAVDRWNSYFGALLYLRDQKKFPLQIVLRNILINGVIDAKMLGDMNLVIEKQGLQELLKYSLIVVASIPVMCIYPFVQKYFIKGVMIGSIKG
jgi:putative aldouronate transport system permease protein